MPSQKHKLQNPGFVADSSPVMITRDERSEEVRGIMGSASQQLT